jgi:hypothetical protein
MIVVSVIAPMYEKSSLSEGGQMAALPGEGAT